MQHFSFKLRTNVTLQLLRRNLYTAYVDISRYTSRKSVILKWMIENGYLPTDLCYAAIWKYKVILVEKKDK